MLSSEHLGGSHFHDPGEAARLSSEHLGGSHFHDPGNSQQDALTSGRPTSSCTEGLRGARSCPAALSADQSLPRVRRSHDLPAGVLCPLISRDRERAKWLHFEHNTVALKATGSNEGLKTSTGQGTSAVGGHRTRQPPLDKTETAVWKTGLLLKPGCVPGIRLCLCKENPLQ